MAGRQRTKKPVRARGTRRRRRGGVSKRKQKGGIFPLLALAIPALTAAAKAAALGAVGGAASYGVKKAIDATRRRR